jgi:hypothetical protein
MEPGLIVRGEYGCQKSRRYMFGEIGQHISQRQRAIGIAIRNRRTRRLAGLFFDASPPCAVLGKNCRAVGRFGKGLGKQEVRPVRVFGGIEPARGVKCNNGALRIAGL